MASIAGTDLRFIDQASLGRNEIWLYVISFPLIVLIGMGLQLLAAKLLQAGGLDWTLELILDPSAATDDVSPIMQAIGFAAIMWGFVAFLIGLIIVVKFLHGRPWQTLFYSGAGFNWTGFRVSLFLALLLPLVSLVLAITISGETFELRFDPLRFLILGGAIILLMPLQVLAEEAVFRGYLMQAIGHFSRSFWVRLLLPAAVFTALHLANREVLEGGVWVIGVYAILAIYLGLLVLRGNGLEYAFGMHLGNNFYVALFVSTADSSLNTPALIRMDSMEWDATVLVGLGLMFALHYILTFSWMGLVHGRRAARSRGR